MFVPGSGPPWTGHPRRTRWRSAGSGRGHPRALEEWFTGLGATDTSTRTDLYLAPADPSLDLKLRGGESESLEVKRRLAGPDRRTFGPEVAGNVEQWYKWSFPLAHAPGLRTDDRTGLWRPVEKIRVLYAFAAAELRSFVGDLADTTAAHVELTAVTTRSETAWTCGVEAAGSPGETEDVLAAAGAELFGPDFPVDLPVERSIGYAAWLGRLDAETGPAAEVLVPSER